MVNTYYNSIFKRKSFHLFRDLGIISEEELEMLNKYIENVVPLDSEIKYKIKVVPELSTTCNRGAQYCIEFYSEDKGNYRMML